MEAEIICVGLHAKRAVRLFGNRIEIFFLNHGNQRLRPHGRWRDLAALGLRKRCTHPELPMLMTKNLEMIVESTVKTFDFEHTPWKREGIRVRLVGFPLGEVVAYTSQTHVKLGSALRAREGEAVVAICHPFQRTASDLWGPMEESPAIVENDWEPRHRRDRASGHRDVRIREKFWISRIWQGLAVRNFFARR